MTQWNSSDGEDPYGPRGYGAPESPPGYAPRADGQPPSVYSDRPSAFERSRSYGIAGTVLTLLGGLAVLASFTVLDWYHGASFSEIGNSNLSASGLPNAYFGWLGWACLVVTVIAGILASVPTPAVRIFRIIGIVVGIAGAGLTFLAIDFSGGNTAYSQYIKNAQFGFYLAVGGFLLAGIGAGIGPRRV